MRILALALLTFSLGVSMGCGRKNEDATGVARTSELDKTVNTIVPPTTKHVGGKQQTPLEAVIEKKETVTLKTEPKSISFLPIDKKTISEFEALGAKYGMLQSDSNCFRVSRLKSSPSKTCRLLTCSMGYISETVIFPTRE
jgi:hypothetical protein